MKKLCIGVLIIMMSIINSSCSHDQKENKYQSQIDKVMEIQQETHKEMVKKSCIKLRLNLIKMLILMFLRMVN